MQLFPLKGSFPAIQDQLATPNIGQTPDKLQVSSYSWEILLVAEFLSGESFELAFSNMGAYEIYFSMEKNVARTCLTLDVLQRIAA